MKTNFEKTKDQISDQVHDQVYEQINDQIKCDTTYNNSINLHKRKRSSNTKICTYFHYYIDILIFYNPPQSQRIMFPNIFLHSSDRRLCAYRNDRGQRDARES